MREFLTWLLELLIWPLVELSTTEYRWMVVIPIVLPLSKLYQFVTAVRNKINFMWFSSPQRHNEKVRRITQVVKDRAKIAPNSRMCTARPAWLSMSILRSVYKKTSYTVDLSDLIDILQIDEKKKTVIVEPMVTCGQLSSTLLPLGWTIEVLPELDDLTVGGLINGFGVETSSHKYGLFQYICESFEIVLADGTCLKCSKTEYPELYWNIPWSHGTLGFVVSAELRIIPAKKYVQLQYIPHFNQKSFLTAFEKESKNTENDFVEALAYSPDNYVLMIGRMTNGGKDPILHLGAWYGPWFYKHVEGFLNLKKPCTERIPLKDYYHRHTRSLFWEMHDILPFGHHPWFRYTLGWLTPANVAFLKLSSTKKIFEIYKTKHVDQDLIVPIAKLGDSINYAHELFNLYPLWLCPCKILKSPVRGLINPDADEEMYVDVGIYGVPYTARPEGGKTFVAKDALRKYESFVRSIKGFQALYALTYQTREEFYKMFDHSVWEKVRAKYACEGVLPAIYDKVSTAARI